MKITRRSDQAWEKFRLPGVEKTQFWSGPGVTFELFRLEKGSGFPMHAHDCWEALFILEGRVNLSWEILGPGDFVFSEPGDAHYSENLEDVVLLLGFGAQYN